MKISTIFFDLGSTLVYCKDPWPPIYARADRALVEVLRTSGITIDSTSFYVEFGGFLNSYYAKHAKNNIEPTSFNSLRDMLAGNGYTDVADSVIRAALDAMYGITQKNWYREDDALPTLKNLNSHGYRLGVISNTSDDKNVQDILEKRGLRPYFECVVTSAALGVRKPDARIFQVALDKMNANPDETAMVGDTLQADVLGANLIGIYSIWITRRTQLPEDGELEIQAQAVITALDQIPDLLDDLEKDQTASIS